jgi:hypothetical protein
MAAKPFLAGTAGTMATNVGLGATMGALGTETGDQAAGAAQEGALAGAFGLAGNMVARVKAGREGMRAAREAQQLAPALNDAQAALIEGAQRAGLKVTPGQALNSPQLRQIEASATSSPMFSPYWQGIKSENQRTLSSLAARAMGVEADNVGPAVLAKAEYQLSKDFEQIGREIGQVSTDKLGKKLDQLASEEATALLPRMELEAIAKRFARGKEGRAKAVGGQVVDMIDGPSLMRERSNIAGEMRDAFANNDATRGKLFANALEAIDDTIRDAAVKTAQGNEAGGARLAKLYDQTRDRWSVLRSMYRGAATMSGDVNMGRAEQIMRKSDARGYVGRADEIGQSLQRRGAADGGDALGSYYDALRFSNDKLGKDIVGDSGTATRLALGGAFEGGIIPTAGRAARALTAGPLARRYMGSDPRALAAWEAARKQSAVAGWMSGQASGGAAGRGVGGVLDDGTPVE